VIVKVTVHDLTMKERPNEAGERHLSQSLWEISFKICRQYSINEPILGGTVRFEFESVYKLKVAAQ